MRRLSSTATGFYKRGFPAFWFGFLGLSVVLTLVTGAAAKASVLFLLIPCVMSLFGYLIMKKVVWALVDEVLDAGDALVVRNRGREYRVPLTDITHVSSIFARPPRVTLHVDGASAERLQATVISFTPDEPFTFNPFAKSALAADLTARVEHARMKR